MVVSAEERKEQKAETKQLKQCIEFILEECRMVLPGIQALFGFQLIAVFNERFNLLAQGDKCVHLAAIFFAIASIGLMMGPAAYHRLTSPESMPPELCSIGTHLVCAGMANLMFSIALEIYLVTRIILDSQGIGIISGAIVLVFFASLWYLFPILNRRRDHEHHHNGTSTPVNL